MRIDVNRLADHGFTVDYDQKKGIMSIYNNHGSTKLFEQQVITLRENTDLPLREIEIWAETICMQANNKRIMQLCED